MGPTSSTTAAPSPALAHDDNALALAGTVGDKAAVPAILFAVLRLYIAARTRPADFDRAVQPGSRELGSHRLAQLLEQHERGLNT